MKVHIITKTYDNNASAIQHVFSSKKKADQWLAREVDDFVKCGYSHSHYVSLGSGLYHEINKNGLRLYTYHIESIEVE